MYWTFSLILTLENAPFPCTKTELIDFAERSGAPLTVLENLQDLDDDVDYTCLEDIWPEVEDLLCPQRDYIDIFCIDIYSGIGAA